jgi:hypothetical protein
VKKKNIIDESPTGRGEKYEVVFLLPICDRLIIILIALEPIKNPYLKKFVKSLLAAFIFGEVAIIAEVFAVYSNLSDEWTAII